MLIREQADALDRNLQKARADLKKVFVLHVVKEMEKRVEDKEGGRGRRGLEWARSLEKGREVSNSERERDCWREGGGERGRKTVCDEPCPCCICKDRG